MMDDIVKEDILTIIGQIQDYLDELESHFEKLESKNAKNSEFLADFISCIVNSANSTEYQ